MARILKMQIRYWGDMRTKPIMLFQIKNKPGDVPFSEIAGSNIKNQRGRLIFFLLG